jgi:exodeoxyribonuclease VIII
MNEIQYIKDSFPEYLSKKDFISSSDIKSFLKSPKYYYWNKYLNNVKEDQRHFAIGSALHEMILEPHLFKSNYIVIPKIDKRTKEGKSLYNEFLIESQGKRLIEENEMSMILEMAENATKNETFMSFLENSHREVSCYKVDETTGLNLRIRPDILPQNKSAIVDIKSCIDSSPKEFKRNVYSYGYSISAAYYCDVLNREHYVFAAIEKQAPYDIALYSLNDEMREFGKQQYRMALDLLTWSYDNNYWCSHNEFVILKECYELGNLNEFLEINKQSQKITIL